jgi:hypothetical protein
MAFLAGSINAQGKLGMVGKKFTKQEADVLFGKVITSVKVNKRALHFATARAKDYVAFKIKNNKALVLNEKRISILDEVVPVNPKEKVSSVTGTVPVVAADEVVYLFSKDVVAQFLNSSTAEEISIENREGVLTLSDGFTTLELSYSCPPLCP